MNHAPPHTKFPATVFLSASPDSSMGCSEMSFRNTGGLAPEDRERAWFAGLLWRAFPDAKSENELAEMAAQVLTTGNRPVTPRAVRNWLRRENTPHFRYVLAVLNLAGTEAVFQFMAPEKNPE
jgi:hypothetical protein